MLDAADGPKHKPAPPREFVPHPAPAGVQKQVRIAHLNEMKKTGRPIVMVDGL
jgi:hypothetical protein